MSAQSDLERMYCEIVERGGGAGLPSMADFKRNDPKVQALLLRQPAKRLSLTLPEVAAKPEPKPKPERKPEAATPQREFAKESVSEPPIAQGLADCRLSGELIQCPNAAYTLAGNRSLASLENGVLEPGNRLGIEPFDGVRNDDEAVRGYLSAAYDRYIPKMLAIGLGANTMSFTAFHNAFYTLESGGVDFSERMDQTYELLKQDRKTLGVKARYHDELPESLAQCVTIDRSIIVCDNVGTNWVFVRTK
ncbi:hypothetical protein [Marinobacter sp. KMM 10035]|uniref:hypothetical protein n=1 Tax=Marinobacter sp. KMM 10035 TaxID=3134034 RepID=UPI00397B6817